MLTNFLSPSFIFSLPIIIIGFMILSTAHSAENVKTIVTSLDDQSELNITVYNSGSSLVRDVRNISFPGGMVNLNFMDVAREIDPTSVAFESLTNPKGISIWEQNYEFDLVSRSKLLEKFIGMQIGFRRFNEETEKYEHHQGVLLSTRDGYVVEMDNKIHLLSIDEIVLPQLPEGLITRPTLVWLLDTASGGKHNVEMSYLTGGLNWRTNYVAIINENDTAIDLNGWVTINNTSGATYKNAKLKLIAGDVHRVMPERAAKGMMYEMDMVRSAAAPPPAFEEKEFFEYHLYTLQRPASLKDNQQKQISLLEGSNVPSEKLFIFDPGQDYWYGGETQKKNVQVKIAFMNSQDKGLGIPLPEGIVRVYKADTDKTLQLIGEDSIDHTPKDEEIRLLLGDAFDVIGERILKNRRKLAAQIWEYDIEVTIKNHKSDNIKVTILDSAWGDWEITKTTHDWKKKDASNFEFVVSIPKDGEVKVEYTVRRQY